MSKLSDFDLDLAIGQEGEQLVRELLTGGLTIEVKRDLRWKDTGNIYIETQGWSKSKSEWYPSGLSVTKAAYWALVLEDGALLIPTQTLKQAVMRYGKEVECKIEPNFSRGYLMKPQNIIDTLKLYQTNKGEKNYDSNSA